MADSNPDFVSDVGEMIRHYLSLRGLPGDDCDALAKAVEVRIRAEYVGVRVRVNAGVRVCTQKRAQIKAQFDGHNMAEITERFGVSRSTVYRYISAEGKGDK